LQWFSLSADDRDKEASMAFDLVTAQAFVKSVDLSGVPRGISAMGAAADAEAGAVFDKAKAQAQIVGSGVFSFSQGVDAEVREAIADSALLAQLVASKRTKFEANPVGWFNAYAEVLAAVGWTLQENGWTDYATNGASAEVNKKIMEVLTAVLAPAAGAAVILTATVKALADMDAGSPWFKLFDRESRKANVSRFQVGLVSTEANGDIFVSMLVCVVQAQSTLTQVLFFKFNTSTASFTANNSKVSLNRVALKDLGPSIRAKTRFYQADYLSAILDLPPV
jgi:hypothetical protein